MDNGSIWDLFQNTPNYDGGRSSMGGSVGVGGYFCRWAPSQPWAQWAALITSRLRTSVLGFKPACVQGVSAAPPLFAGTFSVVDFSQSLQFVV